MYVRGYLQGSENGRVVTIAIQVNSPELPKQLHDICVLFRKIAG